MGWVAWHHERVITEFAKHSMRLLCFDIDVQGDWA